MEKTQKGKLLVRAGLLFYIRSPELVKFTNSNLQSKFKIDFFELNKKKIFHNLNFYANMNGLQHKNSH